MFDSNAQNRLEVPVFIMKMRSLSAFALLVSLVSIGSLGQSQQNSLDRGFISPPDYAKPQVWWHWANGHISKAGITADLEAMKRVGIGGGTICNVATLPEGDVPVFTDEWWKLTHFAVQEANRLGMEMGIENCEGWSSSGGPWIRPIDSMKMVVWSERRVSGSQRLLAPPQPYTRYGFYREIATLAFPTPPSEAGPTLEEVHPDITVNQRDPIKSETIFAGAGGTSLRIPTMPDHTASIEFTCAQPFSASSLRFALAQRTPMPGDNGFEWLNPYPISQTELQTSDDGKHFKTITVIAPPQDLAWLSRATFPVVTARYFRLLFKMSRNEPWVSITQVNLFGPGKSGSSSENILKPNVFNLSRRERLSPNSGMWTLVRLGYTTTGAVNHPASQHGLGLECDKLSRIALERHFAGMMDRVIQEAGPLAGKSLVYSLIDSYEVGPQNWTAGLDREFQLRCGYDPTPWLITLTGRNINSPDESARFNHDFQRTVADICDENYWGYFSELLHRHGMKGQVEAYGNGSFDSIHAAGLSDMPMSEFWFGGHNDGHLAQEAASAAHIYGRPIVGAESFTANQDWNFTPWNMKIWGDWIYTQGVNRYYFHSSTHQPDTDGRKPGTAFGNGIYLTRNLTWWAPGSAWFRYLARCQYLLQQGQFYADIASYEGEDCYQFAGDATTYKDPPKGYALDALDTNTLLNKLTFSPQLGALVLPSGMRYRLLVLPNSPRMSLKVLRKVAALVSSGASIFGPKPAASPGLIGYPACDSEIKRLSSILWGPINGKNIVRNSVGKGQVYWTGDYNRVFAVLADLKLQPDFSYDVDGPTVNVIHRHLATEDLYFVANHEPLRVVARCMFRIAGKVPEVWNPETGSILDAPVWKVMLDGRVSVPLDFAPGQSVFIVFRHAAGHSDHLVSLDSILPHLKSVPRPKLKVLRAVYGIQGEPAAQVDVTAKVQALVKGERLITAATNDLAGGDPAPLRVKSMHIEYLLDAARATLDVQENEGLQLPPYKPDSLKPSVEVTPNGRPIASLWAWISGNYLARTASGKSLKLHSTGAPGLIKLDGAWQVQFDPAWGGPKSVLFNPLVDWTRRPEDGIKHYSGTAVYRRAFTLPAHFRQPDAPIYLDLGDLQTLAEVDLNGHNLGVLWKPPYRVNISNATLPGNNQLIIKVTNNWVNRMVGDAALPAEKQFTRSTMRFFNSDSPLLPSGLFGPVIIETPMRLTQ